MLKCIIILQNTNFGMLKIGTHIQIVMHYKTDRKWEKVSLELLTLKT